MFLNLQFDIGTVTFWWTADEPSEKRQKTDVAAEVSAAGFLG